MKSEKGFTFLEFTVVMIVLGVGCLIIMDSLTTCRIKRKERQISKYTESTTKNNPEINDIIEELCEKHKQELIEELSEMCSDYDK